MKLKLITIATLVTILMVGQTAFAATNNYFTSDQGSLVEANRSAPLMLILHRGEALFPRLTKFINDAKLKGGSISGIGALENVTLSYYDRDIEKRYIDANFKGPLELLSLTGNIAWKKNNPNPVFHIHTILSDRYMHAIGGHLKSSTVAVTAEITITPSTSKAIRVPTSEHKELFLISPAHEVR